MYQRAASRLNPASHVSGCPPPATSVQPPLPLPTSFRPPSRNPGAGAVDSRVHGHDDEWCGNDGQIRGQNPAAFPIVIPAPEPESRPPWIPAFTGMTISGAWITLALRRPNKETKPGGVPIVIPAPEPESRGRGRGFRRSRAWRSVVRGSPWPCEGQIRGRNPAAFRSSFRPPSRNPGAVAVDSGVHGHGDQWCVDHPGLAKCQIRGRNPAAFPIVIPAPEPESRGRGRGFPRSRACERCGDDGYAKDSSRGAAQGPRRRAGPSPCPQCRRLGGARRRASRTDRAP